MTDKEFNRFCNTTQAGTTLSFNYRSMQVNGKFVGCWEESLVFDVNGRQYIWPHEVCECRKSPYPTPTYS